MFFSFHYLINTKRKFYLFLALANDSSARVINATVLKTKAVIESIFKAQTGVEIFIEPEKL